MDRRSYPSYKALAGTCLVEISLTGEYVQGDPFASPSQSACGLSDRQDPDDIMRIRMQKPNRDYIVK